MKKLSRPAWLAISTSVLALGAVPVTAVAQESGADDEIEEITVSGLRGRPRSAIDSAVPIDTFDASAIEAVAHTDTVDILQTLVPSYNVGRQPISDGATFIRPAELRGLPSHHTLVLINGKRRHRASLVSIGGSGTQGPDVATIPSVAIQSLEVLRDGASSQYGSDAIAGVLNFNLRNNTDGITLVADTGQFYDSDGTMYTIQGNIGLPLGDDGFISISGEFNETDFSQRDTQYCENWFCLDPDGAKFGNANQFRQDTAAGRASAPGTPGSALAMSPSIRNDLPSSVFCRTWLASRSHQEIVVSGIENSPGRSNWYLMVSVRSAVALPRSVWSWMSGSDR